MCSLPALKKVLIASSLDNSQQPCAYYCDPDLRKAPLLVMLHTWKCGYIQSNPDWLGEAVKREWIYLQPNFRGPNTNPEACGSAIAQQDILDAIDWASCNLPVDTNRIFLAGWSGGAHMAMLVLARSPESFAAASLWNGISDLGRWYQERQGDEDRFYADCIERCLGGKPGTSAHIDDEIARRSPIHCLAKARSVPIDFNAGIRDGREGSVPVHHTVDAFNVVAQSLGGTTVSDDEIRQLLENDVLERGNDMAIAKDPTYCGRSVFLRRQIGLSRLTVFDGAHESLAYPACEWFSKKGSSVKSVGSYRAWNDLHARP